MNLIPELVPTSVSSEFKVWFRKVPGWGAPYVSLGSVATNPVQALYTTTNRSFGICGNVFYEITGPGTSAVRGILPSPTNQNYYSFASSGQQVLIACGFTMYVFDLMANTLAPVTTPPGQAISQVCFIDGFFIGHPTGNNNAFYISSFYDANTWSTLDFALEEDPDFVIAIAALHRSLWLFGEDHIEVYVDSGSASFPFTRDPSSYIERGCAAAASVAKLDNTLFWLGADERGAGIAYRANGYLPERISTHSEEKAWASYSTIADAQAYPYQLEGHEYYRVDFPTAKATWLYDVASALWHERALWVPNQQQYIADTARYHTYNLMLNKHLVGDYQTNSVYALDQSLFAQDQNLIRWLRRTPALATKGLSTTYDELELLMQTGDIGQMSPGSEPQVMMRYSDNFGQTWSNELTCGTGEQGNYDKRVLWDGVGDGRRRVFEVYGSDPSPTEIAGAWLNANLGTG